MANVLTTGKISYSESGITYYTYKVQATQIESTQAGYVRFELKTIERTNPYGGNETWANLSNGRYQVSTSSNFSNPIASSDSVKYNVAGYVEFPQSYLNQTLYFRYRSLSYGTMSSANMLDVFNLSYTVAYDIDSGVASVDLSRVSSNVSRSETVTDGIVYDNDIIHYEATLLPGIINQSGTPLNADVRVDRGLTIEVKTLTATSFTLRININVGVQSVVVERIKSLAGEPLGIINDGAVIKPQDELKVSVTPKPGFHVHHTQRFLHHVIVVSASDAEISPKAQAKIQYYPFIFDGNAWVR